MGINDLAGLAVLALVALVFANVGGGRRAYDLPVDQASLRVLVTQLGTLQADNERLRAQVRQLEDQLTAVRRMLPGMGLVGPGDTVTR